MNPEVFTPISEMPEPRQATQFEHQVMTPTHPRWEEFREKLSGPGFVNFRKEYAESHWDCAGGRDKTHAIELLQEFGFNIQEIVLSCEYFSANGGFCDCEIVFNVGADRRPRPVRRKNPSKPSKLHKMRKERLA